MGKKLIIYVEKDTNKMCGSLEVGGVITNYGPLNFAIIKEYFENGYELDMDKLSIIDRIQLNNCLQLNPKH